MSPPSKAMMGTYELVRRLGVGGMGEVWLARQRGAAGFSRNVAIKRLLPQAMEQTDVVQMFIEEAQITGRLRHPNVVNVVELGAADSGELYLVLEHVDGTGLHKLLRDAETRPPMNAALAIGREVALALNAAHTLADDDGNDLGLVHRDVTPSNVMIDKLGHVKLMDFGIAKVRAKSNQTEAGIIKGKIAYLAPEQLRGSVDPRSDLFSLGLVVWETIAGAQARSGSSDAVMMAKVALDAIPSILTVMPDLPPKVAEVVDKACALEPDDRYQTGEEMAQAMLDALESLGERNRMELAREDLATAVRLATKRDGDAAAAATNASRTVDGDRPLALTLHSLVMQDGEGTISRPLTADMIRAVAPTDARPTGTHARTNVRRQKKSSAMPIFAALIAMSVVGGAVFMRLRSRAQRPIDPTVGINARNTAATTGIVPPTTPPIVPGLLGDAGSTASLAMVPVADAGTDGGSRVASTGHGTRRRDGGSQGAHVASNSNEPATLRITVRPWGTVSIDGQNYGETPIRPVNLAPGRHSIHVANAERQADRRVSIQLAPGETRVLPIDLTTAQ